MASSSSKGPTTSCLGLASRVVTGPAIFMQDNACGAPIELRDLRCVSIVGTQRTAVPLPVLQVRARILIVAELSEAGRAVRSRRLVGGNGLA